VYHRLGTIQYNKSLHSVLCEELELRKYRIPDLCKTQYELEGQYILFWARKLGKGNEHSHFLAAEHFKLIFFPHLPFSSVGWFCALELIRTSEFHYLDGDAEEGVGLARLF